jgi:hypothetical protein
MRLEGRRSVAWTGLACLAGAALACNEDDQRAGLPVLEAVEVVDATGTVIDLQVDGGAPAVTPLAHFVFRFDRLLDATLLEQIIDGKPVGRAGIALIEGPGGARGEITYVPNGDSRFALVFPRGPQLLVTATPTLPSGSAVRVSLDRTKIRGKAAPDTGYSLGEDVRADVLAFTTEPFAATIAGAAGGPAPDGGPPRLARDEAIQVRFNNLPEAQIARVVTVEVLDAAGAPAPGAGGEVQPDPEAPTGVLVTPTGGAWPAGASVIVRVAAEARDALGVPMAAPTSATFTTPP